MDTKSLTTALSGLAVSASSVLADGLARLRTAAGMDGGCAPLPHVRDATDYLFLAALALLPVDGTVVGWYMPFWTPISPWTFLLYAALNARLLPAVTARFRGPAHLPLVLGALSIIGWVTAGFHPVPVLESVGGVLGALACLASIEIASIKRLDWRQAVRVLIAAYLIALAAGIVQFIAIRFDLTFIRQWFEHLMSRQYITPDSQWGGGRPQFLFAEPSYIGMHLFGVLLPLSWLIRRHAPELAHWLRALVVAFAVLAIAMGSGVRIIIDSGIALVIAIIEAADLRDRADRRRALLRIAATVVGMGVLSLLNGRIMSILGQGPIDGDGSLSTRIVQGLTPLWGMVQRPLNLVFGFGAGNIAAANAAGGLDVFRFFHGAGAEIPGWIYSDQDPDKVFTMSAYASYLAEFGLAGAAALGTVIWGLVRRARPLGKTMACWILLTAYLYVQFEGYAFYALPLLMWALRARGDQRRRRTPAGSSEAMETEKR